MRRFPSDCVGRPVRVTVMGSYVEAYDEAVEVFRQRDLTAWRRLLVFHKSFLTGPWETPLPDSLASSMTTSIGPALVGSHISRAVLSDETIGSVKRMRVVRSKAGIVWKIGGDPWVP